MTQSAVTTLTSALDACACVDLDAVSGSDLASMVVDLRGVATRLEVEIARVVHAAEQAEVWRAAGATSMEVWLAGETHTTVRTAREQVRLASTLAAAPIVAEKMRDGDLSVDNVRLLGAVVGHEAFAGDAVNLVELAGGAPRETKRQLEQWLAAVDAQGETEREETQRLKRYLQLTPNGDGMVDVKGVLTAEDAEHVQTALGHIAGAAYADETGRPHHTRLADALTDLCKSYNTGGVTGGRERPKVLMSVPFETITERAAARGVLVSSGTTINGEAARRLACDAELHRIITKGASVVLDFGTSTRLASESQYLAMAVRDGGCRWPGCDRPPGWCEAHHIDEVIRDDGPTNLSNMVLLCSSHHHYAHAPDWSLVGNAYDLSIRRPHGTLMPAPPRGHLDDAIQTAPIQTALSLAG
ncbi:MAG: DUF222 domain-containing protein [Ilumatobacteraceae bacterium]